MLNKPDRIFIFHIFFCSVVEPKQFCVKKLFGSTHTTDLLEPCFNMRLLSGFIAYSLFTLKDIAHMKARVQNLRQFNII